jgi:hypothetical protein
MTLQRRRLAKRVASKRPRRRIPRSIGIAYRNQRMSAIRQAFIQATRPQLARLLTDLLLRTRHSARRIPDRHPEFIQSELGELLRGGLHQ